MATNNSSIGYSPIFHMPLIAGPAEGVDPAAHYSAIEAATTTLASFSPDNRISINLSDQSHSSVFAITGGRVRFFPLGATLPDGSLESSPAGFGTVGLEPWTADIGQLAQPTPDGVLPSSQPPAHILYSNIDEAEFTNAMRTHLSEMSVPALQASWGGGGAAPFNRTPLEDDFLGQLVTGNTFVFLPGGSPLGIAGASSAMATDVQLDLAFVDTNVQRFSPQLMLTYLPNIAGSVWTGHPMLAAMASNPLPIDIHLKFEVFDPDSMSFMQLPTGTLVKVMDFDPESSDDEGATAAILSNGQVHFSSLSFAFQLETTPDIYFQVETNGQTVGGVTLPNAWSSFGWKATDGTKGYIEDFPGGTLGTLADPIVFRIGMDFHLQLNYRKEASGTVETVPSGLQAQMVVINPDGDDWASAIHRTDANGIIHGVVIDAELGLAAWISVRFNLEADPSRNIGQITSMRNDRPAMWVSKDGAGPTKKLWSNIKKGSIGTVASPDTVVIDGSDNQLSMFHLVAAHEWAHMLFKLTSGDWPSLDLQIYDDTLFGTAYSWPPGEVNMDDGFFHSRYYFGHEVSHQIMWEIYNVDVPHLVILGHYRLIHAATMDTNQIHVMMESWAELFGLIFSSDMGNWTFDLSELEDPENGKTLAPFPGDKGLTFEGAFSNALWLLFKDIVVTSGVTTHPKVFPTQTGNLSENPNNSWMDNADVQSRFQSLIWNPFKAVTPKAQPPASEFINQIKLAAGSDWFIVKSCFNLFNIAVEDISMTSISVNQGPVAGGTALTITGDGFVAFKSHGSEQVKMEVFVGGELCPFIVVNSATEIFVETPSAAGPGFGHVTVQLIIRGVVTRIFFLPNAFEYI